LITETQRKIESRRKLKIAFLLQVIEAMIKSRKVVMGSDIARHIYRKVASVKNGAVGECE